MIKARLILLSIISVSCLASHTTMAGQTTIEIRLPGQPEPTQTEVKQSSPSPLIKTKQPIAKPKFEQLPSQFGVTLPGHEQHPDVKLPDDVTRIYNPQFKFLPIEECLHGNKRHCGKPYGKTVANVWCKRQGHKEVIRWQFSDQTGRTYILGDYSVCSGKKCRGFKWIDCKKKPVRFNPFERQQAGEKVSFFSKMVF